jgi:hypothetical protein
MQELLIQEPNMMTVQCLNTSINPGTYSAKILDVKLMHGDDYWYMYSISFEIQDGEHKGEEIGKGFNLPKSRFTTPDSFIAVTISRLLGKPRGGENICLDSLIGKECRITIRAVIESTRMYPEICDVWEADKTAD